MAQVVVDSSVMRDKAKTLENAAVTIQSLYEVTGIENPKGTNTQDKHLVEFEPVVFEFNRKQDSD